MCTVLLPSCGYPIAVNKHIITSFLMLPYLLFILAEVLFPVSCFFLCTLFSDKGGLYIKHWGYLTSINDNIGRSHWSQGLMSWGLRVRIMSGCVLSDRGLCEGPITCPEESYRVWCVWVWSSPNVNNKKAVAHCSCPVKRNVTIQPHNRTACLIITSVFTASIKILLLYSPLKTSKAGVPRVDHSSAQQILSL